MNKSSPSGRGRKAFWEGGTALLNGMKLFPFYYGLKILNLHSTHRPPLGDYGQPADPGVEDWAQMIQGVRAEDLSPGFMAPAAWQHAFFGEEGEVGGATSQKEAERVTAPLGDTENSPGAGSRLRNSLHPYLHPCWALRGLVAKGPGREGLLPDLTYWAVLVGIRS